MTELYKSIDENTWIVSDTHFGHDNILQFEPSRVEAMKVKGFRDQNEWLIYQWNSVVGEDDLVLHLGDFLFMKKNSVASGQTFNQVFGSIIERLNGRIVMLIGNHDWRFLKGFQAYQKRNPEKFQLIEGIPNISEDRGLSALITQIHHKKIMFAHYPLVSTDPYTKGKSKESAQAMGRIFKKEKCDLCIHGHLHSNDVYKTDAEQRMERNVSIEKIGFKPVRLRELL